MATQTAQAPLAASDLDHWISAPAVRTHRERSAAVDADELWRAAQSVRLSETRSIGRLVRWRIPGTPADLRFAELFDRYPFTPLASGPNHFVSGLCGRIWTFRRDYPRLSDASAFQAWNDPGTVRVLFAHWAEPNGQGGAKLVSETRVEPVDRRAALRLRGLWAVVGRFEPLIGSEPLALAARRARPGYG
jgi:hypothetical protein